MSCRYYDTLDKTFGLDKYKNAALVVRDPDERVNVDMANGLALAVRPNNKIRDESSLIGFLGSGTPLNQRDRSQCSCLYKKSVNYISCIMNCWCCAKRVSYTMNSRFSGMCPNQT